MRQIPILIFTLGETRARGPGGVHIRAAHGTNGGLHERQGRSDQTCPHRDPHPHPRAPGRSGRAGLDATAKATRAHQQSTGCVVARSDPSLDAPQTHISTRAAPRPGPTAHLRAELRPGPTTPDVGPGAIGARDLPGSSYPSVPAGAPVAPQRQVQSDIGSPSAASTGTRHRRQTCADDLGQQRRRKVTTGNAASPRWREHAGPHPHPRSCAAKKQNGCPASQRATISPGSPHQSGHPTRRTDTHLTYSP